MGKRKKSSNIVAFLAITYYYMIVLSMPSYASSVQSSKIFTGTKRLFQDIGKSLVVIAPIVGATFIAYFFVRRAAADEVDNKKWTNRIRIAIGSTIGAIVAGVIISVVTSYF